MCPRLFLFRESKMNWYVVDKDYIRYLEKFDFKVGYIDYGNKLKLYIGIVLEIEQIKYYIPISSNKLKHQNMINKLDFHKVENSKTGQVYAVLNINNMIPVPDKYVTQLKYNEIDKFREFSSEKEKMNYILLLQKEKNAIDEIQDILINKAKKLYTKCKEMPEGKLAKRCCNFSLLEVKSREYMKEKS